MKLVLVIFSSLRADHVSLYGNRWLATDSFSKLGQNGRVFTRARCHRPEPHAIRAELLTGLSARRFGCPQDIFHQYHSDFTLPGRLKSAGYRTALFTDNFPLRGMYEPLSAFDTVCFIPGQGCDRHVPESGFAVAVGNREPSPVVIHGGEGRPNKEAVWRYLRNRSCDPQGTHPSVRLFRVAADYLKGSGETNSFTLIDSFGLGPPWDAPAEFARHRRPEDLAALAWPVGGPIDVAAPNMQANLNFLRRAYADGCVFLDHLLGTVSEDKGQTLVVMSDHGVLIGDEGYLLVGPGGHGSTLVDQVLITQSPRIKAADRRDTPVHPPDLFASLLAAAGADPLPASDGKVIEDLLTE